MKTLFNLALCLSSCVLLSISFAAEPANPPAKAPPPAPTTPSLTAAEKQAGWKLLFDGVSTDGWHGLGVDAFPKDEWEVTNGCLHCLGGKKSDDLRTNDKHENFELYFEWMVPKLNGNSGLKYRVQETRGGTFAFGCEYQCMYDPDATGKDASGSLYDVLPPVGKKLQPLGEFNQSRIIIQGNHVEHWLNGVKVVEYEFGSDSFKEAVAKSKFKSSKTWAKDPNGYITLQDHHDEVWFRNLKIRDLPATAGNGK
ncbi:MAG TPA: DUF1080 domain-containing protein [Tepidisphaeraceae bacterium]|jgi:hypothetical protein|nr:DUF1080 domain-containing protein [Tepidisphaeraceae bacterium]